MKPSNDRFASVDPLWWRSEGPKRTEPVCEEDHLQPIFTPLIITHHSCSFLANHSRISTPNKSALIWYSASDPPPPLPPPHHPIPPIQPTPNPLRTGNSAPNAGHHETPTAPASPGTGSSKLGRRPRPHLGREGRRCAGWRRKGTR